jgi:hypothetical protein
MASSTQMASSTTAKLEADNRLESDKEGADRETAKDIGVSVMAPKPIAAPAGFEMASASTKPVRLAQAVNLPERVNAAANNATATAANDVINERGYWQGLPSAEPVEVPVKNSRVLPSAPPAPRRVVAAAGVDPAMTASVTRWPLADRGASEPLPNALSYASQPTPIATARALPMGTGSPRAAATVNGDTTIVAKRSDDRMPDTTTTPRSDDRSSDAPSRKPGSSVVRVGDRFNDPWMRAMIVSPSAQGFLETTLLGMPDFRNLGPHMQKPVTALTMTFTDDPQPGMVSEKFGGTAVTFISSVKFSAPRATAAR